MIVVRKVNEQVARNPVARALARQRLREELLEQKIKLYSMADGDACDELMEGLSLTLLTIGVACDLQKLKDPKTNVLRGGLSACQQLMLSNHYDIRQTVAISTALSAAEDLNKKLTPDAIHMAWIKVSKAAK